VHRFCRERRKYRAVFMSHLLMQLGSVRESKEGFVKGIEGESFVAISALEEKEEMRWAVVVMCMHRRGSACDQ